MLVAYDALLAAALATHGLTLERTETVDDASWPGNEQLLVYVQGERKGVCDPIIDDDLDSRAAILRIADRVAARVRERHPGGYAVPPLPAPLRPS